jgi:hypothetical protein
VGFLLCNAESGKPVALGKFLATVKKVVICLRCASKKVDSIDFNSKSRKLAQAFLAVSKVGGREKFASTDDMNIYEASVMDWEQYKNSLLMIYNREERLAISAAKALLNLGSFVDPNSVLGEVLDSSKNGEFDESNFNSALNVICTTLAEVGDTKDAKIIQEVGVAVAHSANETASCVKNRENQEIRNRNLETLNIKLESIINCCSDAIVRLASRDSAKPAACIMRECRLFT